jgi:hypothetical protein
VSTSSPDGNVWSRFEHDPRDQTFAGMRASDRDRAVVHDVLSEAYAEGRIDREELDERTAQVDTAKTYAALLPPISDLTTTATPPSRRQDRDGSLPVRGGDYERAARLYYGEKLRDAFFGFLVPNLICWAIWYMTGHTAFIWPLFVTIPTALNLLRVATSRGHIIESRIQKLERREARAQELAASPDAAQDDGPLLDERRETRHQARHEERDERHEERRERHEH